jgi:acyl carrier protein
MDTVNSDEIIFLIKEIFNIGSNVTILGEMGPRDVYGWDSIGMVNLIVTVQSKYSIDFPMDKLEQLNDINSLVQIINEQLLYQ